VVRGGREKLVGGEVIAAVGHEWKRRVGDAGGRAKGMPQRMGMAMMLQLQRDTAERRGIWQDDRRVQVWPTIMRTAG
jgi:hypothetical protein